MLRERYNVSRSKVQMHFCRMKNGSVVMMFYVFDLCGDYHMTTLNSTRPSLKQVIEHIKKEINNQ